MTYAAYFNLSLTVKKKFKNFDKKIKFGLITSINKKHKLLHLHKAGFISFNYYDNYKIIFTKILVKAKTCF